MSTHTVPRSPRTMPAVPDAPELADLRLRIGADPEREMVLWWSTPAPVRGPRVLLGTAHTGYSRVVPAVTTPYRDVTTRAVRYLHHAQLTRLRPGTRYLYAAMHDGAAPATGVFRTAPVEVSAAVSAAD